MGYNTTVIILNDALHEIERDPHFGRKLAEAVRGLNLPGPHDISSGCHCNAAAVVETHHADDTAIVAVGQNCATLLRMCRYVGFHGDVEGQELILGQLADSLGYRLVKKAKTKPKAIAEAEREVG